MGITSPTTERLSRSGDVAWLDSSTPLFGTPSSARSSWSSCSSLFQRCVWVFAALRRLLTPLQELSVWRKQANLSVQDEFTGRSLPAGLEESLHPQLNDLFDRTRNGVRRSADLYINVCNIMDRLVKRSEGVAADHARIALSLQSLNFRGNK